MTKYRILMLLLCISISNLSVQSRTTPTECNPQVDVVFVLNGYSTVSIHNFVLQKKFLHEILQKHVSPPGALQVSFLVCNGVGSHPTKFASSTETAIKTLDNLSNVLSANLAKEPHDGLCLNASISKLQEHYTTNSKKITVNIVDNEMLFNEQTLLNFVSDRIRDDVIYITVVVGIQDTKKLKVLRLISSNQKYYFVLSKYEELQKLSSEFLEGGCLSFPMTNDRRVSAVTTTEATTHIYRTNKCKPGKSAAEYYTKVMFLGWQRHVCPEGQLGNLESCSCVISGNVSSTTITKISNIGKIHEKLSNFKTLRQDIQEASKNSSVQSNSQDSNLETIYLDPIINLTKLSFGNESEISTINDDDDDENNLESIITNIQKKIPEKSMFFKEPFGKEKVFLPKSKSVDFLFKRRSRYKSDAVNDNSFETNKGNYSAALYSTISSQNFSGTSKSGNLFNKQIVKNFSSEPVPLESRSPITSITLTAIISASSPTPSSLDPAWEGVPRARGYENDESARKIANLIVPNDITTTLTSPALFVTTPRTLRRKDSNMITNVLTFESSTKMASPTSSPVDRTMGSDLLNETKGQEANGTPFSNKPEEISLVSVPKHNHSIGHDKSEKLIPLYVQNFGIIEPVGMATAETVTSRKLSTEPNTATSANNFVMNDLPSESTIPKPHEASVMKKQNVLFKVTNFGKIKSDRVGGR